MRVQRSTKVISIDYILIRYLSSNRAWPPGMLAGQVGTDVWKKKKKKKKKKKVTFQAALSSFRVRKKKAF